MIQLPDNYEELSDFMQFEEFIKIFFPVNDYSNVKLYFDLPTNMIGDTLYNVFVACDLNTCNYAVLNQMGSTYWNDVATSIYDVIHGTGNSSNDFLNRVKKACTKDTKLHVQFKTVRFPYESGIRIVVRGDSDLSVLKKLNLSHNYTDIFPKEPKTMWQLVMKRRDETHSSAAMDLRSKIGALDKKGALKIQKYEGWNIPQIKPPPPPRPPPPPYHLHV